MQTIEYHITKSFDKKAGIMHHIISCNGKTIYNLEFKFSTSNTPFSPVDYLEAALNGSQINIVPQYHNELNNIAFELHLLKTSTDNSSKSLSLISRLKILLSKLLFRHT
mgnify:FL=1